MHHACTCTSRLITFISNFTVTGSIIPYKQNQPHNSRTSQETMTSKDLSKKKQKALRKKVWSDLVLTELLQEFPTLALGTASLIASSICNALLPAYLSHFYFSEDNNNRSSSSSSSASISRLIALVLCGGTCSFLRTACLTKVESRVTARVRRRLFSALLSAPMQVLFSLNHQSSSVSSSNKNSSDTSASDIDKDCSYNCINMLIDDSANVGKTSMTMSSIVRSAVSCIYNTYTMVSLSPQLCMSSIFIAPISAVGIAGLLKFKTKARSRQRSLMGSSASFAEERLNNISAVKLCSREIDEAKQYGDMQDEAGRLDSQVSIADGLFMGGIFWFTSASLAAVVYSGRKEVNSGRLSSKGLSRFVVSTFLLGLGVSGVGQARSKLESQLISAQHIYSTLSMCDSSAKKDGEQNENGDESSKQLSATRKVVRLENITFAYSSGQDNVLEDVSLELKPGCVTALVGKNGSGKTTLVSLLGGLYKPNSGCITIDENDVELYDKKDIVSVVQQESTSSLFSMSVMDNIKYSKPDATDEEARSAAALANCESFIQELDGGYSYNIGRGGSRLSGGQRQRLCLARALLTDPRVLVLDEPASQLDVEGGNAVEEAVLACRSSSRSLLLITHKATSLKIADEIVVLSEGCVIESGDYDSLCKKKDSALCRLMPTLDEQ